MSRRPWWEASYVSRDLTLSQTHSRNHSHVGTAAKISLERNLAPFQGSEKKLIRCASDLLKRHVGSHDGAGSQSNKRQKVSQPSRSRIPQACVTCAEAKLRCEGPAPCRRCQRKDLPCTYPGPRQKKGTSLANRPEPAVNATVINEIDPTQQNRPFDEAEASHISLLHVATNPHRLAKPSNDPVVRTEDNAPPLAQLVFDTRT